MDNEIKFNECKKVAKRGGWGSLYVCGDYVVKVHRDWEDWFESTLRTDATVKGPKGTSKPWSWANVADLETIDHPNLVKVIAVHKEAPVIIMEKGEGEVKGFEERVEAIKAAIQLARALDFLHKRDIMHFDVKPSNVIAFKDKDGYIVKLGDYSSVRRSVGRILSPSKLTECTPPYCPPEAYDSKMMETSKTLIYPADVYMLAKTLLKWMGKEVYEIKSLEDHNKYLPKMLEGIEGKLREALEKALSYYPDERPTAEEFAEMLEEALNEAQATDNPSLQLEGNAPPSK